ncbi:MAG: hypothetical protein CMJ64_22185 [Planctomycetaceae bacterium]|nr:hypothetical protein [Planctomycetaceae bacterium]
MRKPSFILASVCVLSSLIATTAVGDVDYPREVKPILQKRCYACHGALKQQSNLRLDTVISMLKGGESEDKIVVAGEPDESLLIQVMNGSAGFRMPPENEGSAVEPAELERIRSWISEGAVAPANEEPQADPATYWSYQVPARPTVPRGDNSDWVRTPIDSFIAAEHKRRGLVPVREADRAVLLRRVYLDLIGLPPMQQELHAFLTDESPNAYERVVDDLLNRPTYGQRWGRHWMDVWRYSDWYGSRRINEIRYSQRHIWRWRDWIVDSLNGDKGYDQMIVEMLAGDELSPGDPDVVVATGFLGRNWYKFDRNVWMFDTVEKTSQALLGLTIRCSRCHDHKYDPISQEDYYRFRAFFEPHDVRTDPISADSATEKDATLGPVLKEGLALVFDKELDRPTYRFVRGDDRNPDKTKELSPGVPASLGNHEIEVQPVPLPPEAFYPALRDGVTSSVLRHATEKAAQAEAAVRVAEQGAAAAKVELDSYIAESSDAAKPQTEPFLSENFAKASPDVWKTLNGEWVYEAGKLIEKQDTSFATIVTKQNHPRNFRAKLTYRPLQPGTYRSIGFSFDFLDTGNSQDVYTATSDARQSVQAFHRKDGKQAYPQAGIVPAKLKVDEVATIEVTARGQDLKIWLNGELKLKYVMPIERRDGKFAVWVHKGTAEFHKLEITPLVPSIDDLRRKHRGATDVVARKQQDILTARAEAEALKARIAAERAKYGDTTETARSQLADAACRAERNVQVRIAEAELLEAKQYLAATVTAQQADAESKAVTDAKQKVTASEKKLADAVAAADKPDGSYSPLGELYPQSSTGRRLALARWVTNKQNPRTARVAANQMWLRHFGEALVPSVANFGLNGDRPSHPELLDWLAVELMESGWSMKHVHRLIVLSSTYRLSSSIAEFGVRNAESSLPNPRSAFRNPQLTDPDNRYLWRMNSRRMEAELVRDSILSVSASLDLSFGGAEIPEDQGESVFRRSMYFRLTPNEKMKFLELFDVADPNSCYRRIESVVPQQALAIGNSRLAQTQARSLATQLVKSLPSDSTNNKPFITLAFETILSRGPTDEESIACDDFLATHANLLQRQDLSALSASAAKPLDADAATKRSRENLVHVLMNHNDFVTIR